LSLGSVSLGVLQDIFELESLPRSKEDMFVTWLQGMGPLPKRLMMFFSRVLLGRYGLRGTRWQLRKFLSRCQLM